MLRSSTWSLSFRFCTKTLSALLVFSIRATCRTHPIVLDLLTQIIFITTVGSLRQLNTVDVEVVCRVNCVLCGG